MRIESSNIQTVSTHEKVEIHQVDERLRMWGNVPMEAQRLPSRPPAGEPMEQDASTSEGSRRMSGASFEAELVRLSLSTEEITSSSSSLVAKGKGKTGVDKSGKTSDDEIDDAISGDTRLQLLRMFVEQLTGEKVHLYKPAEGESSNDNSEGGGQNASSAEAAQEASGQSAPSSQAGWGIEYDYKKVEGESERTSFSSSGVVKTADGKEVTIDVNLEMSRERIDVTSLSVRAGDAVKKVDPLVINFNGDAAALTESKIDFDLNADGNTESISFVRSGSGFLALDKNKDGVVNDGSELFGPTTGNGFAELASYDDDRNGWIDEADSVYADLGVWTRTADGVDILSGLKESNVGAVYLKSAYTPFELNNANNETDGEVRATGIYLQESGRAGTVQQVDLTV